MLSKSRFSDMKTWLIPLMELFGRPIWPHFDSPSSANNPNDYWATRLTGGPTNQTFGRDTFILRIGNGPSVFSGSLLKTTSTRISSIAWSPPTDVWFGLAIRSVFALNAERLLKFRALWLTSPRENKPREGCPACRPNL